MTKIIIGVTDCSKYENYSNWIAAYSKDIEIIRLSEKENNFEDVKRCQGVVFTGGEDVHPRFYGKPDYFNYCHSSDVNEKRDEFELRLMEYTEKNKVSVLGICRGLQLFNVFKGGTLIPDIPTWGKPAHSKTEDGKDRYHNVTISSHSWLAKIIGKTSGEINSNHHQAADIPGEGLVVSARSDDDVIEALERTSNPGPGFLCLVQWHPERMNDQNSIFVSAIRAAFMDAVTTI